VHVRKNIQAVLILCIAVSASLYADVTGSFLGTVRDSTGAVVAGARVTAINEATNQTQEATSDGTGQFRILALPAGRYRIEAQATGFQKFVSPGNVLDVNEQHRVDITLQVGNIEQQVEVSATALQVETTNTQLGEVIDERKVLSLPLNGRSYIDLLGLQAGVAPGTSGSIQQDRPVSGGLSSGNVSVNGQRETANAFLVNGGDVSEGRNLGAAVIPNLDAVAEFRLITNSFDAEYGKFSGAIMNAVTKSGTNGFHAAAFEFLRNDKLDARSFFDPEKGVLKRNQFGYAIGGPFLKNKLFWFTDYQGTREVRGVGTGLVRVPTLAERQGIFSPDDFVDANGTPLTVNGAYWASVLSQRLGYTVTAGQPYSTPGCASTANCVFPGGVIPSRAFAPPVPATMQFIPVPNSGPDRFASAGQSQRTNDDKMGQKVDFINKLTGNWSFYYFFDDSTIVNPLPSASVPGFGSTTPQRAQMGVLSNTHIFGPTAVNEARLSFMRTAVTTDRPNESFAKLSELGFVTGPGTLGIIPSGPQGWPEYLPPLGFNNFGVGVPTLTTYQPNNTWHASDSFSKIHGGHTLKFGGEFRTHQNNERNVCAPTGSYSFDGSETGNDFADYLLGAPVSYTQCSQQFLDSRARYGGAFAQDSWRVTPSLTLNLGLRWEVSTPWYDTQGKIETIVPGLQSTQFPTAPKGWVVPGDPGVPSTLAPTRYNNFGPRVGIAYSPNFSEGVMGKIFGGPGKTSIRASYGIYYTSIEDLNLFYEVGDAPFGLYWPSIVPPLFEEPFRNRADGISQGQRFPFILPTPGSPANKNLDFNVYLPIQYSPGYQITNRVPYAEHYNFSIQRSLNSSTALTLAYVGTQGHRLISQYDANPGNPQLCLSLMGAGVAPGTPECGPGQENGTFTRPDGLQVVGTRGPLGMPAFGCCNTFTANIANSNYNSLQVTVERKAADMTFLAAYTLGKAIDNSSGFNEWVNFSNYRLSRSLSSYDVRHNFVFSYNWVLPFRKLGGPRRLTEGWSFTGVTRFATGFPIGVSQSGDNSLYGSESTDVPDRIGDPVIQDPRNAGPDGSNQYFLRSAFTSGPFGALGNSNRRFFHGPGINNFDVALHKSTRITENLQLELRGEFFNIFNHAQFNNPGGNFSSDNFGLVTSAREPRIGQVALKLIF
jgi:hypothetical protein